MKIKQIATINTGLVLSRKKADNTSNNTYKYNVITLRSIENNALNSSKFEDFISKERIPSRYLSKPSDILLRISEPYNALLISPENQNMVVPSSFYIIKITSDNIIPGYLYWYLNSEYAQKQILSQKIISTMNVIKSAFVRNMMIPLPDINIQNSISNLCTLQNKELKLLEELKMEKQLLYSSLIKRIFNDNCEQ